MYQLLTDSTVDLPYQLLKDKHVDFVSMNVTIDDQESVSYTHLTLPTTERV